MVSFSQLAAFFDFVLLDHIRGHWHDLNSAVVHHDLLLMIKLVLPAHDLLKALVIRIISVNEFDAVCRLGGHLRHAVL